MMLILIKMMIMTNFVVWLIYIISIRDHCQSLPPKTTTHQVLALKLRRVFRIEVCSDNHHYTLAIKDYSINDLKQ